MSERSNETDSKSVGSAPTQVQILSPAVTIMQNYERMMEERTCPICKRRFRAPNYADIAFCSSACEEAVKRAKYKKECVICKKPFLTNQPNTLYCSERCVKKVNKARNRSEAAKIYKMKYRRKPEIMERDRVYRARPDVKARAKAYRQTPEFKERMKIYRKRYRRKPEVREYMRGYLRERYRKKHPRR